MYLVAVVLILIIIFILAQYNKLIKLRNKVKQSKSGIEVYLNQRFDLIPNLVECVKAYSKYESELFENITKLRASYNETKDFDKANKLNNTFNQILALAEDYPDLKASNQFVNLQKNLVKIESQLQAARRIYNNDVTFYNTKIETIPTNIIASLFKFKPAELFQIEEYKRDNINVNIER